MDKPPPGHMLALGMFIFWFVRLIAQFFVYKPEIWKGKPFETTVHILLAILWAYMSGIFLWIYLASENQPHL